MAVKTERWRIEMKLWGWGEDEEMSAGTGWGRDKFTGMVSVTTDF